MHHFLIFLTAGLLTLPPVMPASGQNVQVPLVEQSQSCEAGVSCPIGETTHVPSAVATDKVVYTLEADEMIPPPAWTEDSLDLADTPSVIARGLGVDLFSFPDMAGISIVDDTDDTAVWEITPSEVDFAGTEPQIDSSASSLEDSQEMSIIDLDIYYTGDVAGEQDLQDETGEQYTSGTQSVFSVDDLFVAGAILWQNMKFTYYSERILPGDSLPIPGRHVSEAGFVCDGDGFIVLAAPFGVAMGQVFDTPFGAQGKVYDRCPGCGVNHLDVYTY